MLVLWIKRRVGVDAVPKVLSLAGCGEMECCVLWMRFLLPERGFPLHLVALGRLCETNVVETLCAPPARVSRGTCGSVLSYEVGDS